MLKAHVIMQVTTAEIKPVGVFDEHADAIKYCEWHRNWRAENPGVLGGPEGYAIVVTVNRLTSLPEGFKTGAEHE